MIKSIILMVVGLFTIAFAGLFLEILIPLYVNTIGGNALMFLAFYFVCMGVALFGLGVRGDV
jgi:hypothetical protein